MMMKVFILLAQPHGGISNIFFVNNDGGLRVRVDYRALNKATIKYKYPFPRIDNTWDQGESDSFRQ
jgi:hypothetical protein